MKRLAHKLLKSCQVTSGRGKDKKTQWSDVQASRLTIASASWLAEELLRERLPIPLPVAEIAGLSVVSQSGQDTGRLIKSLYGTVFWRESGTRTYPDGTVEENAIEWIIPIRSMDSMPSDSECVGPINLASIEIATRTTGVLPPPTNSGYDLWMPAKGCALAILASLGVTIRNGEDGGGTYQFVSEDGAISDVDLRDRAERTWDFTETILGRSLLGLGDLECAAREILSGIEVAGIAEPAEAPATARLATMLREGSWPIFYGVIHAKDAKRVLDLDRVFVGGSLPANVRDGGPVQIAVPDAASFSRTLAAMQNAASNVDDYAVVMFEWNTAGSARPLRGDDISIHHHEIQAAHLLNRKGASVAIRRYTHLVAS